MLDEVNFRLNSFEFEVGTKFVQKCTIAYTAIRLLSSLSLLGGGEVGYWFESSIRI